MFRPNVFSLDWNANPDRIIVPHEWDRVKKLLAEMDFTKLNFSYTLESDNDYRNHVIPDFETVSNDD